MCTKPVARAISGSANQAPSSENIATRDIDSTPPATTSSEVPVAICPAAVATASSPDVQKRLIVCPGTLCHSASSAAVRAMFAP